MWISFARSMGGMMVPAAEGLAELAGLGPNGPAKILYVAAVHGMWGIAFARRYPKARVEDRYSTIVGSAFEAGLESDYDVALIPNFLHHFNAAECE